MLLDSISNLKIVEIVIERTKGQREPYENDKMHSNFNQHGNHKAPRHMDENDRNDGSALRLFHLFIDVSFQGDRIDSCTREETKPRGNWPMLRGSLR